MLQEIGFPWFILAGIAGIFVLIHNKRKRDNAVGFQLLPKFKWEYEEENATG